MVHFKILRPPVSISVYAVRIKDPTQVVNVSPLSPSHFIPHLTFTKCVLIGWSSGRMLVCCTEGRGSNPRCMGAQEFLISSFISRYSAACRSHGTRSTLYSVFYAEASEKTLDIPE